MTNKNKKAFTLVELLAVIVILAVILVIAVPSIMSTIMESKKGTLASSAKLIASSAESMKLSNQALGIEKDIICEDVANISSENYDSCVIEFVNGEAKVTIVGKGKFEGMGVLLGTSDNAIATKGLEKTNDGNIRYTGKNPNNYVEFGNTNELWRIIGIFTVITSKGTTEKLMKIVRDSSIGDYSWDSSTGNNNGTHEDGEVKDASGNEIYSGADLKTELNTLYLNSQSGYCCKGNNQATCDAKSGAVVCDFTNTGIKEAYRGMIESVVWNTGAFNWGVSAETAYEKERGTTTGQICKGTTYQNGAYCIDEVTRTVTWEGKVGLIYPSDYGYASTNSNCRGNISDNTNFSCKNTNWLHNNTYYWTLSPGASSNVSHVPWSVYSTGCWTQQRI